MAFTHQQINKHHCWLVVSTLLKHISQMGLLFPIYGKINKMFQTTNQIGSAHRQYSPSFLLCFAAEFPGLKDLVLIGPWL